LVTTSRVSRDSKPIKLYQDYERHGDEQIRMKILKSMLDREKPWNFSAAYYAATSKEH
jgi:hypothetical protein